jgi:hypothetical protein
MQNYHFADTPPDTQFEGEDDPEQLEQPTESQIEPSVKHHGNLKRKRPNDIPPPIERNLWPCKQVDYQLLDDPLLAYDLSPELTALAKNDPEEESAVFSPNEVIGAMIDGANLASEDPQSLTEACKSSKWPEWEKSIQIESQQLRDQKMWKLTDPPDDHIPIKNKWVFQKKYNKEGMLTKYKA